MIENHGVPSNSYTKSLDLTPGGSSGGESALISMHGSPMGIGTDIGGSIVSARVASLLDQAPL